jgi:hypothetical protein
MTDRPARIIAALAAAIALAAAGGFTFGSARADSTTEPDAAALAERVDALESQVDSLHLWAQAQDHTTDQVIDAMSPLDCLAFSSVHAYRETLGPKGRKYYTFPIMLWNVANPACKPSKTEFRRRLLPVTRGGKRRSVTPGQLPG